MPDTRERFELAVLDQLGEGIIIADAEGRILAVNPAAEIIHGRVRLDVPPDAYSETYHLLTLEEEPYPPEKLPLTLAVREGRTIRDAPWKIRRPDGSIVVAVGSASPVLAKDGRQIGAVLTMRDETRRYEAEHALKAALAVKETLLFEVNHRVRNSLQVVSSIVSLHMRTVKDADARHALNEAQRRIEVIAATHRSLYELGTHDWVDCTHLLPDLCKQIVETFAGDREVEFAVQQHGKIYLAVSQAVSLCLAVTELTINACKYAFEGRPGGRITLLLDGSGPGIQVCLTDDGVGISEPDNQQKSGIGALIVSNLAHGLKADIDRQTGPDGTSFTITFERQAGSIEGPNAADRTGPDLILDHWQANRLA